MIRLAYDHQIFATQQYGGISRYFFELASRLDNHKECEVSVIAPLYVNQYLSAKSNSAFVHGKLFPWAFRGFRRTVNTVNQLLLPAYWVGERFDIIHETYFSKTAYGSANCRVLTVYDMISELYPEQFIGISEAASIKRAAVARADHIICISESTRRDLIRIFGVDEHKTSVVHLGYSLSADSGIRVARLASGKPYLLYVGMRQPDYKNFMGFCRAYSTSAQLMSDFDIVAFGGGGFTLSERQMLDKLGIQNNVHQVGGNDAELCAYYKGAAIFVYPSMYEGFGIPPLEAMNFGCPVACSNVSSVPEVVGEAAEFFDPSDESDMRRAIESVVYSESRVECLRTLGTERLAFFSWDKCAQETLGIYQDLFERGKVDAPLQSKLATNKGY
ncbi:glycosyltransferase family 4 protein [Gallionella capsiferriformans]|uniref:Glycosyl transferase group 1 n=1 Tax=Gallionella capsiferriformans (strain ES-2) TaxID=395494 RepID=D9SFL0_GALCS|nr:glycosyltransferase family 1 protein [Gallionella capsiferriformans]ADL55307.1 glycosyl transferase group 1 [Gallionella capsiferriformans ES-2]